MENEVPNNSSSLDLKVLKYEDGIPIFQTSICPIQYSVSPPKPITSTQIKGVPGAFMLHNVLSQEECQQYINITEKMGYGDAPITTYGTFVSFSL
jgi:hypothetical protein